MFHKIFSLIFAMAVVLSACTFHPVIDTRSPEAAAATQTARAEAALLPTVTPQPEVVPNEEVGEVAPDPLPEPPCDFIVDNECLPIKGNISTRTGEKIYFTPQSVNYKNVKIDEAAGEKFFRTEQEALDAGWRKALR